MTSVSAPSATVDVHQHLWPIGLVEALRRRNRAPRLRGWTLELAGEPPFQVDPADHAAHLRRALDADCAVVGVSLSSPLGIESLPVEQSRELLDAWHHGAAALPDPFRAWVSVSLHEPDLAELKRRLDQGFLGLQLPATALACPAALETLAPVLAVCAAADRPVFVHPGPATTAPADSPAWWPAVVDYPSQLHAAWFVWQTSGRRLFPQLRMGFAAGAGLAPLHHERFTARGGGAVVVDPLTFVETSSYGPRAVDALVRVLGIDVIVHGSDRPYATAADLGMGAAARRAIQIVNPHRFLYGGAP